MGRRRAVHKWEVIITGYLHQWVQAYDRKEAIEAAINQAPEQNQGALRRCKSREFITKDHGKLEE